MSAWYAVGGRAMCRLRKCFALQLRLVRALSLPIAGGSGSTSIGNHPRSGANGLSTKAWFPRVTRIWGCPRWTTLRIGLYNDARVVDRRQRRETHGHPLGEVLVAGSRDRRHEGTPRPSPYRGGTAESTSGQRRPARPPELVRVGIDHPVRPGFSPQEPRHARHPLVLTKVLARLANQANVPGAGVR